MAEIVRRLIWFTIVAVAISFVLFAVLGNFADIGGAKSTPVPIRDAVSSGVHKLTGILVLPLACDELSVEPQELSPTQYELVFQTWQDPSIPCPETPTPRAFETVAFAPSTYITFTATLDGTALPITVLLDTSTSTNP